MEPQNQQTNNTKNPQNPLNNEVSAKKDLTKKILVAVILSLLIAIGAVTYFWNSQTKELKQNRDLDSQKIQELEKKLNELSKESGSDGEDLSFLKVPEWNIMFEINTQNPSYVIGGLGDDVALWLTNKASKETIQNGCDDGDTYKLYPAAIKRFADTENIPDEAKEFNEKLGTIDGYSYYLGFGKEACSTDPQEGKYRLEVYDMAKTIQKLK